MDFVQHASEYTLFSTGVGEAEGEGDCFASCSLFDAIFTGTLDIAVEASIFWRHMATSFVLSCAYGGARLARSAANSSTGPLAVLDDL